MDDNKKKPIKEKTLLKFKNKNKIIKKNNKKE